MPNFYPGTETALLFGLDERLGSELEGALREQGREYLSEPWRRPGTEVARPGIKVVFCPADRNYYRPLLDFIRQRGLKLPVVVVSGAPELTQWLDALDAGVADYCSPPFESSQICWILDNTLKYRRLTAA